MTVRHYRLIQGDVYAMQLTAENAQRVISWCGGQEREEIDALDSTKRFVGINVPTLEGVKRASIGDYIVKLQNHGIDVMPAREFESKYEPI